MSGKSDLEENTDWAYWKGKYGTLLGRINSLEEKLKTAKESRVFTDQTIALQKKAIDNLSSEKSKHLRQIKRLQNG